MVTSFVRVVVLYVLVSISMRIMGKRTIGEMHPTDLVVSIMISDLASVPMQSEDTPLWKGIIPIFTLVALEMIFAYLILKIPFMRRVFVGRSCSVVKDGKLNEKAMRVLKISVEDVEEQIRLAGYSDISKVRDVIVETSGQVSVIGEEDEKVPYVVITDGRLRGKDMEKALVTKEDVSEELLKRGIKSPREVLYMSMLNSKVVHLQKKAGRNKFKRTGKNAGSN